MITKGLKVGDKFTDGGLTYKVTKVVGENYESEWVGETSPKSLVADEPKKEEVTDYSTMPYAQLKKVCAEKGVSAKGSREELIARLEG